MTSINGTAEAARLVCTGSVGGVNIFTDVTRLEPASATFITIGATAYVMNYPPGWPQIRPTALGAGAAAVAQNTLPPGARVALLACESAALVAAGAATYS